MATHGRHEHQRSRQRREAMRTSNLRRNGVRDLHEPETSGTVMSWYVIYRKGSAVQLKPMKVVNRLADQLRSDAISRGAEFPWVLDAGCGTDRHTVFRLCCKNWGNT